MDGLSNNQNQSTGSIGFPPSDPTSPVLPVSNNQTTSSNFPGDMPSADVPIPQNDTPTLIPPSDGSGTKGSTKASFGKSKRKALATILGLVLLIAGVGTGVYLVGQQQNVSTRAYVCSNYVFEVKQDGEVTIRNGSTQGQPSQDARVYINGNQVATVAVPRVDSGTSRSIGKVAVPSGTAFQWRVEGAVDCETTGENTNNLLIETSCGEVLAYDTDWNLLSQSDLSNLSPNETVRFAVTGKTSSGTFEAAKFTINGVEQPETTKNRVVDVRVYTAIEFYMDYVIPSGVDSFQVSAKVKHSLDGWF